MHRFNRDDPRNKQGNKERKPFIPKNAPPKPVEEHQVAPKPTEEQPDDLMAIEVSDTISENVIEKKEEAKLEEVQEQDEDDDDDNVCASSDDDNGAAKSVDKAILDHVKAFHNGFDVMNKAVLNALIDMVYEQCNVKLDEDELIRVLSNPHTWECTIVVEDSIQKNKKVEAIEKKKTAKPGERGCVKVMISGPRAGQACGKGISRSGDPYFCTPCLKLSCMKSAEGYNLMVKRAIEAGFLGEEEEKKPATKARRVAKPGSAKSGSESSDKESKAKKAIPASRRLTVRKITSKA